MKFVLDRKTVIGATGLYLVVFLLMHMFGNLKLLAGFEDFDEYAYQLRYFLHPTLPPFLFLWVARGSLVLALVAHLLGVWGIFTRRDDRKAWPERPMVLSGAIIAVFVVVHLLQFTAQIITVGYAGYAAPHARVVLAFNEWWVVAGYAFAMAAVCLHIWHGLHRRAFKLAAWAVSSVLYLGFMLPPVLVLSGVVAR